MAVAPLDFLHVTNFTLHSCGTPLTISFEAVAYGIGLFVVTPLVVDAKATCVRCADLDFDLTIARDLAQELRRGLEEAGLLT